MSWRTNRMADHKAYMRNRARQKRRYRESTDFSNGEKREWTQAEEELVLAHAVPDRELAKRLRRNVPAIQTRRCVLKRGGA